MLTETYKEMGQMNYKPSQEDVKSYMRMVDKNSDGKVTLEEFEEIVLMSLHKAGFDIYEWILIVLLSFPIIIVIVFYLSPF